MTRMVYSPEPKALARTDVPGTFSCFGSLKRFSEHGPGECAPLRAQKATPFSMSRGFILPNLSLARNPASLLRHRIVGLGLAFLFVFAALATGSAHAQSASTWNKRGESAELHEDYDAAYVDYGNAHKKNIKDIRYKERMERMRYQASVQHVDRGRVLRQNGDYSGALSQFLRAAEIDPGNETARQEIGVTQAAQPPPQASGPGAAAALQQQSQQSLVMKSISSIAPPIELKPVSTEPITLHMVEDVKVIYQAIGKVAGLNILFSPEYTSKRIPVDLTNVSVYDALRIVGTLSGTFFKVVTPNTLFVAANTRTNHTDIDELAVQTFYLSNSSQPNDGNEILTGLRLLLDPSVKLYLVPSQNAIVMRGTSDELLLAQKLINDFDRARPEVVVDVAVLEVNRDKVRNLGITLPQSIGLTPQLASTTAASTTTTGTTTTGTTTTGTTSGLTLNNLAHLNATDFAVSITGGTLNALLTDSDTRILQNPRIRATDGQRATLKIGSKIPIATGSTTSTLTTTALATTQFTYIDVGVNIDMTPTVHYNRDVTLKMKIEVSSQSGTVTIETVSEPIISQRVIEQVIQLKDGEPSILAGIITHSDSKTVSGTPGLGELPFFKYFFSSQNKETAQDEIVFLLIPHIVRESLLTRLNTAAIDTGTGSNIELRKADPSEMASDQIDPSMYPRPKVANPTTAANAAGAILQQLHQDAQPPTPDQMRQMQGPEPAAVTPGTPVMPTSAGRPGGAAAAGAAGGTASAPIGFTVKTAAPNQTVGSTFQTTVMLTGGKDVYSVAMQAQYDPKVLQLVNVDSGDFLSRDLKPVAMTHRIDNGTVVVQASRPPQVGGINGDGSLCTLTFKAIGPGDSAITLSRVGAKDSLQANIPAVGTAAVVHVQ